MALIGGGGGGGGGPLGSGNPFTGTASTIEAMGGGIWGGWSGKQDPSSGGTAEAFNFLSPTTGLIAHIGWGCNFDEQGENHYLGIEIKVSNSVVWLARGETTSDGAWAVSFPYVLPPIVIPAQSEVVITVTSSDAAVDQYVTITAREI